MLFSCGLDLFHSIEPMVLFYHCGGGRSKGRVYPHTQKAPAFRSEMNGVFKIGSEERPWSLGQGVEVYFLHTRTNSGISIFPAPAKANPVRKLFVIPLRLILS